MKVCIVGYTQDSGGHEALALARTMAGRGNMAVIVCVVTPETWGHTSLGVDQDYGRFLEDHATELLNEARTLMGETPHVRYERIAAPSASEGLTQAAERERADLIVLGCTASGNAVGRLFLGSVTDEILHSSARPVAIAPPGYTATAALTRLTAGFSGSESARSTVLHALGMAGTMGVPLRLASFAVRDRSAFASRVGPEAEQAMLDRQTAHAQSALDAVRSQISVTGYPVETAIGVGLNWDDALTAISWQEGDLMLLGSSRLGALQRVFLGSNAAKIVRASTVPVIIVPRQG
ncbi:universal stress protein [Variovorax sp. J22R133]|uniref:universal stress protein n=1 Tax=Variovorax brevis TaxID=3053503 RepID=UPI00257636A8|nr:universal stress protein [Variovorax sp. J22R133]MDM0115533.1 universal stress protein [Variovorax sp. J22R133]